MWSLGWPVSLGFGAIIAMSAADTLMVGALGKVPLAAVAMGNLWSISLAIFGHAGVRALDPIVAQAFGRDDREAAGRALVRGWVVAVILAIPVMWGHLWAAEGLRLLQQPEHLIEPAAHYARLRALGLPFAFTFDATRQFLQGLGVMRPATRVALACNLFNVVANAALIFGVGPIPALGAAGSAIATALSMFALSAGLLLATRPTLAAWWPQGPGVLAPRAIGRLLLDALPVGLQTALEVWAFNAAGVMMGWFGDSVVAAHTVALQLASLTFTVPFGISAAAATRVGNLFGAGLAWGRSALVAVGLGAAVMSVGAVLFASLPGPLAAAFNRDPEVLEVAVRLLPIAAAFALFDGTQVVAFGALRGVGDIRVPTLANVLGFWLLGLPVGYVLAFPYAWGPVGVWAGLTLGLVSVASLLLLRLAWLVRRAGGLDAAPQTAPGRAS